MEQLELYVPKLEDLWFYQKMMSDPETMSYNANWDVNYDGYHRDTGCVDYPDAVLPAWYENMVGQEPERFYAYIKRSADGAWIGDVNFHYNPAKDWWDMGIVLYAPYRGKGYAVPALKLMLEHAFRDCGISRIHNDFEVARNEISAWETHRRAGFRELGMEDGFLQMMITKEDYFARPLRHLRCHLSQRERQGGSVHCPAVPVSCLLRPTHLPPYVFSRKNICLICKLVVANYRDCW